MERVTDRELRILQMAADGFRYIDLARELKRSESNIRKHAAQLFSKIGADNIHHAVAIGFRKGLIR